MVVQTWRAHKKIPMLKLESPIDRRWVDENQPKNFRVIKILYLFRITGNTFLLIFFGLNRLPDIVPDQWITF